MGPRRPLTPALGFAALLLVAGCRGGGGAGREADADPLGRRVLDHVSHRVITATYADLETAMRRLQSAVDTLAAAPTEASLEAARAAWRGARTPWEQGEAFLFGPADFDQIDPLVDTWPVDTGGLEAVLASGVPLTTQTLAGLDPTLQGFHTTEYLLFGRDGRRSAASLTPRERAYLVAATTRMADQAARLHRAWAPDGGDYAGALARAGETAAGRTTDDTTSAPYGTPQDALYELVMGSLFIADEVASEKIQQPLTAADARFVESRYSGNSVEDFQDNLRSIMHVYDGAYDGRRGPGLAAIVAPRDPALDRRFRAEVDTAMAALSRIPPPFSRSIATHPDAVRAAMDAIRRVQQTIEEDVTPLMAGL